MRHDLYEWLRRIKAVEREHSVLRFATDLLLVASTKDQNILEGKFTLRDIGRASDELEATYIIRLFAAFETGLRVFWAAAKTKEPPSRTKDLLDGVAAARRIPHGPHSKAHAAREYRNRLVHEQEETMAALAIAEFRSYLCTFFSFLPPYW